MRDGRRHECGAGPGAVAGAVFGWLRLRSGSVLAPLIAHAALNDSALLAGRAAHRLSRPGAGPPG
ncbi:MAG TPA: CPBP family intramembrane glutamic endopeptidase [Streptosporangiaceae bacterium]|nr:CPBP family intramembrane glutamic endopeptidase [Streptosporangiaceae bacterium]